MTYLFFIHNENSYSNISAYDRIDDDRMISILWNSLKFL